MSSINHTSFTGFILLGFSDFPLQLQKTVLGALLCIYLFTLTGNILIITLVTVDHLLQVPMYIFLRNLSFLEVCFISVTVPRTLVGFASNASYISFLGCAVQMLCFSTMGVTECVFLGVMAYDRYVAICNPLLYSAIMTSVVCFKMMAACWLWGISLSVVMVAFIFSWPYCGSNVINHFFCDLPVVLSLACADIFKNEVFIFVACVIGGLVPFALISFSYGHILSTIMKMTSAASRHKAFSTCASHFVSVVLFYGSIMFMYLRPRSSHSKERDKLLSLLYSVAIPLLNPLIYSLRNQELKSALRRLIRKHDPASN